MLVLKFSQPEEGEFAATRTAVPRACLCVHEGIWQPHFKEHEEEEVGEGGIW